MFGPHHIRGHILSSLVKPDKKSPRRQMGHPHGQRRAKRRKRDRTKISDVMISSLYFTQQECDAVNHENEAA
jgi:hypothetical protein